MKLIYSKKVIIYCLRILFFLLSLFLLFFSSYGQSHSINPKLMEDSWNAQWVSCPEVSSRAYGVYHFRKTIDLKKTPASFIIHVSADNRYRLYVNGVSVGRGPARGDLYNWHFGSYNIAPHLHKGNNVIAALVWNMGEYAPVAQISNQTGFLLQGDTETEQIANTDRTWKVLHDTAYTPCALNVGSELHSYFVVGPGDEIHGDAYPWAWESVDYNDEKWLQAKELHTPVVMVGYGTDNLWTLTPRSIPQMEETMQRFAVIRRGEGIQVHDNFLQGKNPLVIPAHTKANVLIDQSYETVAYPEMKISGGKGASIRLTYAESLFDKQDVKGNRNAIEGKAIKGLFDTFHPDGGDNRVFGPLWVRTFRYLQLDIQTGNEPLAINDIYSIYSTYPFEHKATFVSNDSSLQEIWKVGWRTVRLCAGETYFDCPYYEQLQYEGDTRIQALISLYNTGDDRLVRKAIHDFYLSRTPEGLTQGRYPSSRLQVIPPYSLFWVSMLYDYHMLSPDTNFIKPYLDAAAQVLKWYQQRIDADKGMLGPMDWWNFTDWNLSFKNGVADGATSGNSSVLTLQYAYTLEQAAALFNWYGRKNESDSYSRLAKSLAQHTYELCFDSAKMEMANQPDKKAFSQHAGIMAVLANAIPTGDRKRVMENILSDSSLSQATFYYRFYLTRAIIKAGLGDLYYSQLTLWRDMLKIGLTTFAENPEPTRSDCHAWSASPMYDFLATVCGIMPDAPGFQKVRIEPFLGELKEVKGTMPSPKGIISVTLKRKNKSVGVKGEITLPQNLDGKFIWNGIEIQLHGDKQKIDIN